MDNKMDNDKTPRTGITSNIIVDRVGYIGYEYISQAGFQDVDFNMQRGFFLPEKLAFKNDIDELLVNHKKAIIDTGLQISQAHAPYYYDDNHIKDEKDFYQYISILRDCIDITIELNVTYLVVHPLFLTKTMRQWGITFEEMNSIVFRELIKHIKNRNLYLAIENLPYQYCNDMVSHRKLIQKISGNNIVACFDTGHALLSEGKNAVLHAENMHDLIHIVHIHDNNGIIDKHTRVSKINDTWIRFIKSFLQNDKIKTISLETSGVYKTCIKENIKEELKRDYQHLINLLKSIEKRSH